MSFYEYPLFVDILLVTIYVLLFATVAMALWSMINTMRQHKKDSDSNTKATRYISASVLTLLVATLCLTWLFADSTPMSINGKTFTDTTMLDISEMLINSSLIMIFIAAACVIICMAAPGRRK